MTDTIQDAETVADSTGEGATSPQVDNGKDGKAVSFSQTELDAIVQSRLARQSQKFQDYEELKKYKEETEQGKLSEVEKLNKVIEDLKPRAEQAEARKELLEGLLADQLEGIAEDKRSLLPDDFSVEQKLSYLRSNQEFFRSQQTVKTPTDAKPKEGKASGFGGKYDSLDDFAKNDPVGYLKSRQKL
jgi:cysteinyl-tRNA synthetase